MHKNLPDDSAESYGRTGPGQPDSTYRSWTDGDTVAHEYRAGESSSPGRGRRKRDLRKEVRGTEVLEAIMAGFVIPMTVAVFLGGVVMGVIVVIAIAVRREDRRNTLPREAPDRLSRNTRRLTGVSTRDLDAEFLRPAGDLVR